MNLIFENKKNIKQQFREHFVNSAVTL